MVRKLFVRKRWENDTVPFKKIERCVEIKNQWRQKKQQRKSNKRKKRRNRFSNLVGWSLWRPLLFCWTCKKEHETVCIVSSILPFPIHYSYGNKLRIRLSTSSNEICYSYYLYHINIDGRIQVISHLFHPMCLWNKGLFYSEQIVELQGASHCIWRGCQSKVNEY